MKRVAPPPPALTESPEFDHHEGSFRMYAENKTMKVRHQFEFERAAMLGEGAAADGGIFEGTLAYVNGYTEPPPDELRRLIVLHGGRAEPMEHRGMTHIICESVPDTKAKHLLKKK